MGRSFTVYTDHKPLENLNLKSRTDEELGDLTYYISQYDLQIKYAPGKQNLEADCLSRNPVLESNENLDEQLKVVNLINYEEVKADQKENKEIQDNITRLNKNKGIYVKRRNEKDKIILTEDF